MTRITIATTVHDVGRSRCDGERALAFGAYRHVADARYILAIDVTGEIGADDRAAMTGLVAHDNERSAQMMLLNGCCNAISCIYSIFSRYIRLARFKINNNAVGSKRNELFFVLNANCDIDADVKVDLNLPRHNGR